MMRPTMQETQKVLLIVNPHAGGGRGRAWAPRLAAKLQEQGWEVQTVLTKGVRDAEKVIQCCEADLILVAGGDGAFHDAINGLWRQQRKTPVGLIPIGTGNVFAAGMGISAHPIKALEQLLSGQVRWLDVGYAHDRLFHLCLGVGFDAFVVAQMETVSHPQKRFLGKLVYVLQALRYSLRYRWSHLVVEAELADGSKTGWEKDAWLLLVTNLPDYGGVKIAPEAKPDDGALDLCILPSRSKIDYFRFAMLGVLGWHRYHPEVVVAQIRSAHISSHPPVPTQMDGEPSPSTPVTVQVLPLAIPVILP